MSYTSSFDPPVIIDAREAKNGSSTTAIDLTTHNPSMVTRHDVLACLLLALLVVSFSWRLAVLGYLPNSIDFLLQYYPNLAFLGESLRSGQIPLWNPLAFSGTPYFADPQSAVLYLPNWPFLLLLDTATAARAIVVAHYLLATVSAYFYMRAIRLSPAPALVGAAVFGLSQYTMSQISGMPLLINLAWIPAVLLLLELALQRRSTGFAVATGVALAFQLFNGWLHGLFVTAFAVLATIAWHLISQYLESRDWRPTLHIARLAATTGVVWAALSAALLLPTFEFIGQSNYIMQRSLEQAGGEGNVTVLAILGIGGSEGHGAYLGMVGLLLVLVGALFTADRRRSWLYLGLGSFSLLTAFGTKAPLYAYLYQWVPGFQTFHTPGRFMVLYLLSASALAALGTEVLIRGFTRRQLLLAASVVGLLMAPLYYTMSRMFRPEALGWLLENLTNWSAGPYLRPEEARHISLMAAAGVILLVLRAFGLLRARSAYYSVLVLLLVDLFLMHGIMGPYVVPPREVLKTPDLASQMADEADREGPFRLLGYPRNGTFHFLSDFPSNLIPELLPPNLAMVYGVEDVQGYNPLQLRRYAQYMAAINGGAEDYHWAFVYNLQSRLLDLLNVGYVALRGNESRLENVTLATALNLETSGQAMTAHSKGVLATGLQVHSYLGHSADMTDGQVAARITVKDASGRSEILRSACGHGDRGVGIRPARRREQGAAQQGQDLDDMESPFHRPHLRRRPRSLPADGDHGGHRRKGSARHLHRGP